VTCQPITIYGPVTIYQTGTAPPTFTWAVGPFVAKEGGQPVALDITMSSEQAFKLKVTPPTTAGGQPATFDGPVQFTVVTGDCTLDQIDDLSTWVLAGAIGQTSTIQGTGDADLGAGVVTLSDTAAVHVTAPQATALTLEAEEPILKTDVP